MQIILNPKKEKHINFKFEIEGIDEDLKARLVFPMNEGLNLVYESDIIDGNVSLKIPALKEFYKQINVDNVMMEVISESHRFETWRGSITFEQEPKITVESVQEEVVSKVKSNSKISISEMQEVEVETPTPKKIEKKSTLDVLKGALK